MKKLFTLLAACLVMAIPASAAVFQKTLLSETFALCSQGSIETPTTENIYDAATGEISSQYLTTSGWKFVTQSGTPATGFLTQGGGAAYVEGGGYATMLQSPTIKWAGSTDGMVTVTFEVLTSNAENTDMMFEMRTSSTGKKQKMVTLVPGEWQTISLTYNAPGDEGNVRIDGGDDPYFIRNLVVSSNVEAPDYSGSYDFTSTLSVINEKSWTSFAIADFTFSVEPNTGEDAATYPYILKNFLPYNMPTGKAPHDLKAFYGGDGSLVIQGGCDPAHYVYGESNESAHLCIFDTNGYAGGNGQIVLSKTETGYTVTNGFVAVQHSKYDFGFMKDDTPTDIVRYTNVAITRAKPAGIDEVIGTYYVKGTRNAESLVDLSSPKSWKFVDGEGSFTVELNEGDDAVQYPLIIKGFLGTPEFAVKDIKAHYADGVISIPQGKNVALYGSNPRAFLCTTTADTKDYTATEEDIVLEAAADEGLVPSATVAVGYHEDGIALFGIPDTDEVAYIYSSLVFSREPFITPEADTETLYFTAEQLREEVANIGQALIGILNVTTTGDKYINGAAQTERASADGTLAGVRAPQEAEYIEVLPAEGGYYLRQHSAEGGQGYLACAATGNFSITDQAGANIWTILGPDEEGYGEVSNFDDIYSDIAAEVNPNMVRFISNGQYLNGQAFGATGGLRGGTGAWSFNYVRNANYAEAVNYRPALEEAIAAGKEALEEHLLDEPFVTVKGEGLITTSDQFASEYADSDEGKDFGALIDNEPSTFWHTDWHGSAPEGAHSFDVSLPENTLTSLAVVYTGRLNQNNCSPIVMTVYGKNEGEDWEVITTLTQEDGLGAYAGQGRTKDVDALTGGFTFQTEKVYTNFRFEAHAVWADAGLWTDIDGFEMPEGAKANDEKCFNYSEFQMYEAETYKYDIDPEVAAALEAAVTEGKALLNDETVADDDAQLQTATEAINAAIEAVEGAQKVVFTYTIAIEGAAEGGAIIDGEECVDGMEITGLVEITAENVTPVEVEGYEAVVTVENGVITVTYTQTTGINAIATDAKNAAIFNLQGQRLNAAGRGLNVVNGKVVLKK